MRFGFVLSFSVALLACSSPDNTEEDPCGPNGECPTGFTCDSRTTKCVKNGTTPDARQPDAKPSIDATSTIDATATIDAAASIDARPDAAPQSDAAVSPDAAQPDAGGNTGVDAGPVIALTTITGGGEDGFCTLSETFTYRADDATATFECGLDGTFGPCSKDGETFSLVEGNTYMFSVRAINAAGTGPSATRTCLVDTTAPVVTITKPAPASTQGAETEVVFTVSEPANQTCALNGTPLQTCASGMKLTLAAGAYTLVVTATDLAGNVGMSMVTWNVVLVGPTADIDFPTEEAIVGSDVTFSFTVGSGAVGAFCQIDGNDIDCDAPSLNYVFDDGGPHTFSVQGVDAAGNMGVPDVVNFTVDGSAPRIETVDPVALGNGSVRFEIEVSDISEIIAVVCAIDDGPQFTCGEGTSVSTTMLHLTPGPHTLHLYGEDVWHNSGEDLVERGVPAAHAEFPFNVVVGPGHLIVMGFDFFNNNNKLPQGSLDIYQMLFNAVGQSPSVFYDRPVKMGFLDINTESEETDTIQDILSGYDIDYLTLDASTLVAALNDIDVLFIPDQNGALDPDGPLPLAAELAAPLKVFLEAGGVAVILDGTYDNGDGQSTSNNFRILDGGSLLSLQSAEQFEGCTDQVCNGDDPLFRFVGSDTFCGGSHIVAYDTFEPWITLHNNLFEAYDAAFVMHKWFGVTDYGPIAIQLSDFNIHTWDGLDAAFQGDNGWFECRTLSNGSAVHMMSKASAVSLGIGDSNSTLITVLATEPLEHIVLPFTFPGESFTHSRIVDLPGTVGGAVNYFVLFGCGSFQSESTTVNVSTESDCFNSNGTVNVIGEARDANGEVLAYTMLTGVPTDPTEDHLVMDPWLVPNFHPTLTLGSLTDVDAIMAGVTLSSGAVEYNEAGTVTLRHEPGDGVFDFYSAAGTGAPQFAVQTNREGVEFNLDADDRPSLSMRAVRGPLTSSRTVNLSSTLLGRLSNVDLSFNGDQATISFSAAGSLGTADGGFGVMQWDGPENEFRLWFVVFPPGTSVAPPPPFGDMGWRWPTAEDNAELGLLGVEDVSFLPTYALYRQRPFGSVLAKPQTSFSIRRTMIGAPQGMINPDNFLRGFGIR